MPIDPMTEPPYPFQDLLGFRLVEWKADYCLFELPLEEKHQNRFGIPHGGVYATMLDTVMGFSGSYTGDLSRKRLSMTLSMNTNFLSRPTTDRLICEGFRTGGGARSFFARGLIRDSAGHAVAEGTGVFRYRSAG
ncbi:PaaI family thioesterase [Shimia sp.]|uniref:PaaI family thioesterase n=1 Tax=Shimia sp. TaxID=1954381 RepID=UPI0035621B0C